MSEHFVAFPETAEELVARAHEFRSVLSASKQQAPAPGLAWYPYDSLASIDHARLCLDTCFPEMLRAIEGRRVLDIGCADGDLAMFFASFGLDVTAVDHRPTNYNWMAGISALRERLALPVKIREWDADAAWPADLPAYGLTLLLGILYHLKNPFHVLESVSACSRYCLMSTRIAEATPRRSNMRGESLAYLLESGEANADETNYWIFSSTALDVLVRRSGWKVLGRATVGETRRRSEPVRADRDAREFLFLRSMRLSLPAQVTPLQGWGEAEGHGWAWTLKQFSVRVVMESGPRARAFRFGFRVPEVLAAQSGEVALSCAVNGTQLPRQVYSGPGDFTYEAAIPPSLAASAAWEFDFVVQHGFRPAPPESRDLGVIVSMRGEVNGTSAKIPFYLD